MKKQLIFTTLALSFVLGAAQLTFAQDQTIDDFTTGNLQPVLVKTGSQNRILTGKMLEAAAGTSQCSSATLRRKEIVRPETRTTSPRHLDSAAAGVASRTPWYRRADTSPRLVSTCGTEGKPQ